ncbi:hypothetical protein Sjap_010881 [Stephania japonica]|uniref:Reticulon-like protein n=1 Tax=Stephania japonica TaxID=461633 RepID=A0AAP0JA85_9MAGN
MMESSSRRRRSAPGNVVAGSVWESRIKLDEVKGGIKVFNGENRSGGGGGGGGGGGEEPQFVKTRKTWKPDPVEVIGEILLVQAMNSRSDEPSIGSVDEIEKTPIHVQTNRYGIDECFTDNTISRTFSDEEDERDVIETEVEKKSFNDKEVDVAGMKLKKTVKAEKKSNLGSENPMPISSSLKKQSTTPLRDRPIDVSEVKPKKIVRETRKVNGQVHEKTIPISANVKKPQIRSVDKVFVDSDLKKTNSVSEEVGRSPDTPKKFQNIVNLIMWRDLFKSAFVFGLGVLTIILTYCAEFLNFSFVSAVSYMGLVYVAAVFVYKSILCRRTKCLDDSVRIDWVKEEEAIWVSKLIVPYLNEVAWTLSDLFSGDPVTTMKLAVVLFVFAQCGSTITFGAMIKLGFVGVFTVPKLYSLYSESVKLLVECFWNDWDACSYKKPLLGLFFILVWCISTVAARLWAVFMLIVSIRYYQSSLSNEQVGRENVKQKERKIQ